MTLALKWRGGQVDSGLLNLETEFGAKTLRVQGGLELLSLEVQVDRWDLNYGYTLNVFSSDGTFRAWRGSVDLPCAMTRGFAEISGVVKHGHLLRVEMSRVGWGPTAGSPFTDVRLRIAVRALTGLDLAELSGSGWDDDPFDLGRASL